MEEDRRVPADIRPTPVFIPSSPAEAGEER